MEASIPTPAESLDLFPTRGSNPHNKNRPSRAELRGNLLHADDGVEAITRSHAEHAQIRNDKPADIVELIDTCRLQSGLLPLAKGGAMYQAIRGSEHPHRTDAFLRVLVDDPLSLDPDDWKDILRKDEIPTFKGPNTNHELPVERTKDISIDSEESDSDIDMDTENLDEEASPGSTQMVHYIRIWRMDKDKVRNARPKLQASKLSDVRRSVVRYFLARMGGTLSAGHPIHSPSPRW